MYLSITGIIKRLRINLLMALLFSLSAAGICQSRKIDSLKQKIQQSSTVQEQLQDLLQICAEKNSLRGDTLYSYAAKAKKIARQLNDENSAAWADYYMLAQLLPNGKADSMLLQVDDFVRQVIRLNDRPLYYKAQLLKANALNRNNQLNTALALQLKLITQAENEKNTDAVVFLQNYLGATYLNLNNAAEAKNWWLRALELIYNDGENKYQYIQSTLLGNLGLLYYNNYALTGNKLVADSGIAYLTQSIEIARAHEFLATLASALVLKGNFLAATGNLAAAGKNLTEGISIRNKVGDPFYIMQDLINLSAYYTASKQYENAIESIRGALRLADSNHLKADRLQMTGVLAYAYKAGNNYEAYSKTLEEYITLLDSNSRSNATKQLAEIQTSYDVQKKETLIAQQKLSLFKRKLALYGGVLLSILLSSALAFRFRKYQLHQKTKIILLLEEKKKLHELAVKEAEEKERKRIAAELHDNLGVQANAILHNSTLLRNGTTDNTTIVTGLQETAREMLLNLRETLWAMKTADVTAKELWLRIINFIKQMGRNYTSISFKVEGVAPEDLVIHSNKALNIVLVVQETVTNAIKHSGSSSILTSAKFEGGEWRITITDAGAGFDLAAALEKTDSYGLKNMQDRGNAGGFLFNIDTDREKGTSVSVCIRH